MTRHSLNDLQRICANRARRERILTPHAIIDRVEQDAERTRKKLGHLIELWLDVMPSEVSAHTGLIALRRGVLHVHADSASVRYEVDRLLREGAEAELRRRFRGTLRGVKVGCAP